MKNPFNVGSGFVDSYDYSISGLSISGGCVFGCSYCYAPTIIRKNLLDFQGEGKNIKLELEDWEAVLDKYIHKIKDKTIYANVMTDPYQPKVAPYTTMLLRKIVDSGYIPRLLVLQTRSPLVIRDIDLFKQISCRINFTIETNDEEVRKNFTPNAPGLEARWKAIKALSSASIPVCITCTPTLPFKRNLGDLKAWCQEANDLATLTHVVIQSFHDGSLTNTPEEGKKLKAEEQYLWYFHKEKGFKRLCDLLKINLRVPLMEGKPGFAPEAPNE